MAAVSAVFQNFWSHIQRWSSTWCVNFLCFLVLHFFVGKSKISNFDSFLGNKNIWGLQVSMDDLMVDKRLKPFDNVQHVWDGFGFNEFTFFFYFALEVSIFAKLTHNVNAIILIKLSFDFDTIRFWFQLPLDVEFIGKHFFLGKIVENGFIDAFYGDFLFWLKIKLYL